MLGFNRGAQETLAGVVLNSSGAHGRRWQGDQRPAALGLKISRHLSGGNAITRLLRLFSCSRSGFSTLVAASARLQHAPGVLIAITAHQMRRKRRHRLRRHDLLRR